MITDSLVAFVPQGAPLSLVGLDGVAIPSSVTIDLLGTGVGTAPKNIIGNASLFGTDMGVNGNAPELNVTLGDALVTGNAATLNVALQGAPDTAGTHLPGTWQTIAETGPITAPQGTAGQIVARFPFLPSFPANLQPRYLRLLFSPPAATHFTAGTVASALVTMVRDDQANKFATKNFSVA